MGAATHAARIVLSLALEEGGGFSAYSTAMVTKSIASVFVESVDQSDTPNPAAFTIAGVSAAPHRSAAPPFVEMTFVEPLTVTAPCALPIKVGVVLL
jgi:hypothetical protein